MAVNFYSGLIIRDSEDLFGHEFDGERYNAFYGRSVQERAALLLAANNVRDAPVVWVKSHLAPQYVGRNIVSVRASDAITLAPWTAIHRPTHIVTSQRYNPEPKFFEYGDIDSSYYGPGYGGTVQVKYPVQAVRYPYYCSCSAFIDNRNDGNDQYRCKHMLAAQLKVMASLVLEIPSDEADSDATDWDRILTVYQNRIGRPMDLSPREWSNTFGTRWIRYVATAHARRHSQGSNMPLALLSMHNVPPPSIPAITASSAGINVMNSQQSSNNALDGSVYDEQYEDEYDEQHEDEYEDEYEGEYEDGIVGNVRLRSSQNEQQRNVRRRPNNYSSPVSQGLREQVSQIARTNGSPSTPPRLDIAFDFTDDNNNQ